MIRLNWSDLPQYMIEKFLTNPWNPWNPWRFCFDFSRSELSHDLKSARQKAMLVASTAHGAGAARNQCRARHARAIANKGELS
jgi:hypothetical protein